MRNNLVGKRYGKLKVISLRQIDEKGQAYWLCKCDCGAIKKVAARHLRSDRTISCGCLQKLPIGHAARNVVYRDYKRKAEKMKREFCLSVEEFVIITSKNCHYCDSYPTKKASSRTSKPLNGDYIYNGIDRKDNNIGYTLDNSLPCCEICNRAKSDMSYPEFMSYLNRIRYGN